MHRRTTNTTERLSTSEMPSTAVLELEDPRHLVILARALLNKSKDKANPKRLTSSISHDE